MLFGLSFFKKWFKTKTSDTGNENWFFTEPNSFTISAGHIAGKNQKHFNNMYTNSDHNNRGKENVLQATQLLYRCGHKIKDT